KRASEVLTEVSNKLLLEPPTATNSEQKNAQSFLKLLRAQPQTNENKQLQISVMAANMTTDGFTNSARDLGVNHQSLLWRKAWELGHAVSDKHAKEWTAADFRERKRATRRDKLDDATVQLLAK